MDQALRQLVQQGTVAFDTAVAYARDREAFHERPQLLTLPPSDTQSEVNFLDHL